MIRKGKGLQLCSVFVFVFVVQINNRAKLFFMCLFIICDKKQESNVVEITVKQRIRVHLRTICT